VDRLGGHGRGAAGGHPGRSARIATTSPLAARPIPPLALPPAWQAIPIAEGGEPLVALGAYAPARIAVEPRYHQAGYPGALPECYLRAGVARRLAEAARALPSGWRFVVFDGWRPVPVQQALYDEYRAELRARWPAASDAWLDAETARYVSRPSADPVRPAPHLTGGAVDLGLRDAADDLVAMGTPFDACEPASATDHFERRRAAGEHLTPAETAALRHRRLLYHALTAAGFSSYGEEWWHFECDRSQYGPILTLADGLQGPPPRPRAGGHWYRSPDGLWCLPGLPAAEPPVT
jgi:zinc D-Ala-D-Ala dipeptidase